MEKCGLSLYKTPVGGVRPRLTNRWRWIFNWHLFERIGSQNRRTALFYWSGNTRTNLTLVCFLHRSFPRGRRLPAVRAQTHREPGTALLRCPGHKTRRAPEQRAPRIIDSSKLQYVKRTRGTNDESRSRRTLPLSCAITRSGCGPVVRTKKEQVIMESSCPQFEAHRAHVTVTTQAASRQQTGSKHTASRQQTAAHISTVDRQNTKKTVWGKMILMERSFRKQLTVFSGCVCFKCDRRWVSEAADQNFSRCSSWSSRNKTLHAVFTVTDSDTVHVLDSPASKCVNRPRLTAAQRTEHCDPKREEEINQLNSDTSLDPVHQAGSSYYLKLLGAELQIKVFIK